MFLLYVCFCCFNFIVIFYIPALIGLTTLDGACALDTIFGPDNVFTVLLVKTEVNTIEENGIEFVCVFVVAIRKRFVKNLFSKFQKMDAWFCLCDVGMRFRRLCQCGTQ